MTLEVLTVGEKKKTATSSPISQLVDLHQHLCERMSTTVSRRRTRRIPSWKSRMISSNFVVFCVCSKAIRLKKWSIQASSISKHSYV